MSAYWMKKSFHTRYKIVLGIVFFWLLISSGLLEAAFENSIQNPFSVICGGNGIILASGIEGMQMNPANTIFVNMFSLSGTYRSSSDLQNLENVDSIKDFNLACAFFLDKEKKYGRAGIGLNYFGSPFYSESKLVLNYSYELEQKIVIGVNGLYYSWSAADIMSINYPVTLEAGQKNGFVSLDIGALYPFYMDYYIGVSIYNITKPVVGKTLQDSTLPLGYNIGAGKKRGNFRFEAGFKSQDNVTKISGAINFLVMKDLFNFGLGAAARIGSVDQGTTSGFDSFGAGVKLHYTVSSVKFVLIYGYKFISDTGLGTISESNISFGLEI